MLFLHFLCSLSPQRSNIVFVCRCNIQRVGHQSYGTQHRDEMHASSLSTECTVYAPIRLCQSLRECDCPVESCSSVMHHKWSIRYARPVPKEHSIKTYSGASDWYACVTYGYLWAAQRCVCDNFKMFKLLPCRDLYDNVVSPRRSRTLLAVAIVGRAHTTKQYLTTRTYDTVYTVLAVFQKGTFRAARFTRTPKRFDHRQTTSS